MQHTIAKRERLRAREIREEFERATTDVREWRLRCSPAGLPCTGSRECRPALRETRSPSGAVPEIFLLSVFSGRKALPRKRHSGAGVEEGERERGGEGSVVVGERGGGGGEGEGSAMWWQGEGRGRGMQCGSKRDGEGGMHCGRRAGGREGEEECGGKGEGS